MVYMQCSGAYKHFLDVRLLTADVVAVMRIYGFHEPHECGAIGEPVTAQDGDGRFAVSVMELTEALRSAEISTARATAEKVFDYLRTMRGTETEIPMSDTALASLVMQDDMIALMTVLGISTHARDASPHEVMVNEVIPAVQRAMKERVSDEACERVAERIVLACEAGRGPDFIADIIKQARGVGAKEK